MKKAKTSFVLPLFVMIVYGLLIASRFLRDRLIEAGGNLYLSVIILQILVFLLPAIVFCRLKGVGYSVRLNVKLFSPIKFGAILITAAVMILGSILIRYLQIYVGHMTAFRFSLMSGYMGADPGSEFLYNAMAFAVVPALAEEFIFRGILLTEYNEAGYRASVAVVISALLSSMMYFSLELLPIRFLSAFFLCLLTYATGSSLAAFLCHILFNIYGVFGEQYVLRALSDPTNRIIGLFTFLILFLVMLTVFFSVYENTFRRMGQTGEPTPSYRLKKTDDGETPDVAATEADEEGTEQPALSETTRMGIEALFSPTFLLCILIFAVAIFGSL